MGTRLSKNFFGMKTKLDATGWGVSLCLYT